MHSLGFGGCRRVFHGSVRIVRGGPFLGNVPFLVIDDTPSEGSATLDGEILNEFLTVVFAYIIGGVD